MVSFHDSSLSITKQPRPGLGFSSPFSFQPLLCASGQQEKLLTEQQVERDPNS